ncbi:MAG: hypothetical protein MZW92_66120 [Comamonadaceae bacterium]|nr:hypothetical protein [Comamonadaceae bacterium]
MVTPQLVDCLRATRWASSSSAVQTGEQQGGLPARQFRLAARATSWRCCNLLLAGNTQARSIPELADVVARHDAGRMARKFLLVPYHMIGARDMESAILGQYAEYVRKKHPEAPVPGFYLAEGLFKDAREPARAHGRRARSSRS